jgi:hypothetical protein
MRGEVVVQGRSDHDDLWPYAGDSKDDGATSVVNVTVHDSQEFVGVLRMMLSRGLDVTRAELDR